MNDTSSYRQSHSDAGYGKRYNSNYAAGYYAAIYREFEQPILTRIFADLSNGRRSLLDFACGTGRITQLAPPHFERVVGVDVSQAMLENAAPDKSIQYVRRDITKDGLGEQFSVVTAFRFFLNAEPKLREDALAALRNHLVGDGKLVCNVHMNANSVMGLFYRLARMVPALPQHNTLSYADFEKLLRENGFIVERVVWYGALPRPGRHFASFFERWLGPIERTLQRMGLHGRFCHSFIVVAGLDASGSKQNT